MKTIYVVLKDGKEPIFLDDPYMQFTRSKAHASRNARRMRNWFPKHSYTVHTVAFPEKVEEKYK